MHAVDPRTRECQQTPVTDTRMSQQTPVMVHVTTERQR